MDTPKTGGEGILWNGAFVPTSPPLSYVPCRGEPGIKAGKVFLPVEPFYSAPKSGDAPAITTATYIDRACPWIDQIDMRVATPCLTPYNWTADTANRTLILDTVPDADATPTEKALPGYVANPGITLSSRTHLEYDITKFDDANGVAYLWTYGNSPATPHPALRAGESRYGYGANLVGTAYNGTSFIPGAVGNFINGNLKLCAYRYGLLLSDITTYGVKVKIGRATATWSAGGATLTLATDTTGAAIKYSTDGSAPTLTYTTPLAIAATTAVRWKATKTGMVDSDEWQTVITYSGATPPADFSTVYFSALPAFVNSPVQTEIEFQRKPDYYVAPSGTGDGLTPANAANAVYIIGKVSAGGMAGANKLVWCAEGTYTNPTGNVSDFFSNDNSGITVRGGYSADYTERDVKNRKTVFKASVWGTPRSNTAAINQHVLRLTNGVIDGCHAETEVAEYGANGGTAYTAICFSAAKIYNCHFAFSHNYDSAPSNTYLGGGAYTRTTTLSAFSDASALCFCSANIVANVPANGDSTEENYTVGHVASSVSGPGGCYQAEIRVGMSGTLYGCDIKTELNVGRGGDSASTSGASISPGNAQSEAAAAGSVSGRVVLGSLSEESRAIVSCSVGRGGNGGTAGSATWSTDHVYGDRGTSEGGSGGSSSASVSIPTMDHSSSATVNVSAGSGGNGGSGGTSSGPTGYYSSTSIGGPGGSSTANFVTSSIDHRSIATASVASGNGGSGGGHSTTPDGTSMGSGTPGHTDCRVYCTFGGVRPEAALTCDSGNGGTNPDGAAGYTLAQTTVSPGYYGSYRPTLSGNSTCGSSSNLAIGYLVWDALPTYFNGTVAFTEGAPYGNGNPVRVNHSTASTTGWYSGMDNGNGAPLAGYTTAQGSGVVLGRYWE